MADVLSILQKKPTSMDDIIDGAKLLYGNNAIKITQDIDSTEGMAGIETSPWGNLFKDLSTVREDVEIIGQDSLTKRLDNLVIPEEQGGAITENTDFTPRLSSSLESPVSTLVHYGFSKRISDIASNYSDFNSVADFLGHMNRTLDTYAVEQVDNLIVAGADTGSGFLATNNGMVGVISASSATINGQLPVAVPAFTSSAAEAEDVRAVVDELGDLTRTNGFGSSKWKMKMSPVAFKSMERVLINSGSIQAIGEFNNNRRVINYDVFEIKADRHLSTRDLVCYKEGNVFVSFGKGDQRPKTKLVAGETFETIVKTYPYDVIQADPSASLFARFGLE